MLPVLARSSHGYAVVRRRPVPMLPYRSGPRVRIDRDWAVESFIPTYRRARRVWGSDEQAIAREIVEDLFPDVPVHPQRGHDRELVRRVRTAVAVLLNHDGIPAQYPQLPVTPRPPVAPGEPAWYRALRTGWAR